MMRDAMPYVLAIVAVLVVLACAAMSYVWPALCQVVQP